MTTEQNELVDLLLDVAREREVDGSHAAAQRLRRVAAAISEADGPTLVAMGFLRRPFADLVAEMVRETAHE